MKRILVTGGGGFLGSYLCEKLLEANNEVICLDNFFTGSKNNIRLVPASSDMSHIFVMNDALASGEIVSIPGDRIFGSPRYVECDFLGSKARFPLGPFVLALQRNVPTLAIFVMKASPYRYQAYVRRIQADDRKYTGRNDRAANLAQHFASEIEQVLEKYPEQWFNFYEFWNYDTEQ